MTSYLGVPIHSLLMMGFVFFGLVVGSCVYLALKTMRPNINYVELKLRIQSWWVMIIFLFAALVLGVKVSLVFFALLSFMALKEFFSIVPIRLVDRRVLFWAYLAIPFQYYAIASQWYGLFIIVIPVYVFLFLPFRAILIGETDGFIKSSGIIHWGVMLTVFCLSHIAYLLQLPVHNERAGSIGLVLFLIFVTQFNDVCQYIWGKLFGKHKIVPKVSPNKTWEGFLGGLISMMLVSFFLAPYLTPLSQLEGLCVGAIISCSGFVGDVVMSAVKRDLRIKDSSKLIPGHGGILDRLDSLIYTAPLFFHFLYYLYY